MTPVLLVTLVNQTNAKICPRLRWEFIVRAFYAKHPLFPTHHGDQTSKIRIKLPAGVHPTLKGAKLIRNGVSKFKSGFLGASNTEKGKNYETQWKKSHMWSLQFWWHTRWSHQQVMLNLGVQSRCEPIRSGFSKQTSILADNPGIRLREHAPSRLGIYPLSPAMCTSHLPDICLFVCLFTFDIQPVCMRHTHCMGFTVVIMQCVLVISFLLCPLPVLYIYHPIFTIQETESNLSEPLFSVGQDVKFDGIMNSARVGPGVNFLFSEIVLGRGKTLDDDTCHPCCRLSWAAMWNSSTVSLWSAQLMWWMWLGCRMILKEQWIRTRPEENQQGIYRNTLKMGICVNLWQGFNQMATGALSTHIHMGNSQKKLKWDASKKETVFFIALTTYKQTQSSFASELSSEPCRRGTQLYWQLPH